MCFYRRKDVTERSDIMVTLESGQRKRKQRLSQPSLYIGLGALETSCTCTQVQPLRIFDKTNHGKIKLTLKLKRL